MSDNLEDLYSDIKKLEGAIKKDANNLEQLIKEEKNKDYAEAMQKELDFLKVQENQFAIASQTVQKQLDEQQKVENSIEQEQQKFEQKAEGVSLAIEAVEHFTQLPNILAPFPHDAVKNIGEQLAALKEGAVLDYMEGAFRKTLGDVKDKINDLKFGLEQEKQEREWEWELEHQEMHQSTQHLENSKTEPSDLNSKNMEITTKENADQNKEIENLLEKQQQQQKQMTESLQKRGFDDKQIQEKLTQQQGIFQEQYQKKLEELQGRQIRIISDGLDR